MAASSLSSGERLLLLVQREIGRITGLLWIPFVIAIGRFGFRWRIEGVAETRREFRRLRKASSAPLLVCGNHLTMLDSFLIAMALGGPWYFITHYASIPWNTPARENFASVWWKRILVYLVKCIPVSRGGDRRAIGNVLARISWLLSIGEVALIFPEGGRSRTGRVDTEAVTYGVGGIVKALPDCRVLCVYVRGDKQQGYTTLPARGDRFRVVLQSLEPKTTQRGLRGSLNISKQIISQLADMERGYFDDRK